MIPIEIIFKIFECFDVKDLLQYDSKFSFPDAFWKQKAIKDYGNEFWEKAKQRPSNVSKPKNSWKEELIRIVNFQSMLVDFGSKPWTNKEFYVYWNKIDQLY